MVELTSELIAEQMLMRAVSHAVVLSDNKPSDAKKPRVEQSTGYIAVATMRVPKELAELKKSRLAELEQYWVDGRTAPHRAATLAARSWN